MTALDTNRIRQAISGPGADTRTWIALGRVDSDPDAVRWDPVLGWLADVTFTGGPLDGDGPNVCRVASPIARAGSSEQRPLEGGELVVVLLPDGDANVEPTILGALHSLEAPVPSTVNGTPVDEAYARLTAFLGAPLKNWDVEVLGARLRALGVFRALGATVELADEGAAQPYVRGAVLASAVGTFTGALSAGFAIQALGFTALAGYVPFLGPIATAMGAAAAASTSMANAATAFGARFVPGDVLSTRIRGE